MLSFRQSRLTQTIHVIPVARQVVKERRDVLGDAVREELLLRIAAHVREGQNGDRRTVGKRRTTRRDGCTCALGDKRSWRGITPERRLPLPSGRNATRTGRSAIPLLGFSVRQLAELRMTRKDEVIPMTSGSWPTRKGSIEKSPLLDNPFRKGGS